MRFAALALVVAASLGCKGKSSDSGTGSARGSGVQVVVPKGFVPIKSVSAKVTYSTDSVSINGEPTFEIAPDQPITGVQFNSLRERLKQTATGNAPLAVVFDGALTFTQVGLFLAALKVGGYRHLALMSGSGMTMIPVELAETDQLERGLRPAVVLEGNGMLTLFSLSGEEGTKDKPKLTFDVGTRTSLDGLTAALSEIVHRRWPNGQRSADDRVIAIVLDGAQLVDRLLMILAAVQTDGKTELFPTIFLAGGV